MMKNSHNNYGAVSRTLHWLIALSIIGLMAVGLYMEDMPRDHAQLGTIYNLHKASGSLVLCLVIIRVLWLAYSPAPALPAALSERDMKLAKFVKRMMYTLMFIVPAAGILMSTYAGKVISIYNLFELPLFVEANKDMAKIFHSVHGFTVKVLFVCVILHIAGAIKHRRSDNMDEDVLPRMGLKNKS
jgi:cytochrome b561